MIKKSKKDSEKMNNTYEQLLNSVKWTLSNKNYEYGSSSFTRAWWNRLPTETDGGRSYPTQIPKERMENANFEILKKLRKMKMQIMNDEII